MSNPLRMFRRYQKVLLAFFGVLMIIAFTVGGIIDRWLAENVAGGTQGEVVASWRGGEISEDTLGLMQSNHGRTLRFLEALALRTQEAGGEPKGPGVRRDQTGRLVDPGIPRAYSETDLVHKMLLAEKAREMGMAISDDAILEFLDRLSDDMVPRSEYPAILREATGNSFYQQQLFEQLRTELMAMNVRYLGASGLAAIPPATAWDYFNRLNRRVKVELLPLTSAEFVSQVAGEPTEAEIETLYRDGQQRFPDPNSPEPGFKRRRRIAFEYLKADLEKFVEQAMVAVTDDEVRKYYEENEHEFQISAPAPPVSGAVPPSAAGEAKPAQAPAETGSAPAEPAEPAAPAPADDSAAKPSAEAAGSAAGVQAAEPAPAEPPAEPPAGPPAGDSPTAPPAAAPAGPPPAETPAAANPAAAGEGSPPAGAPEPSGAAGDATAPSPADPPPAESRRPSRAASHFVSLFPEDPPADPVVPVPAVEVPGGQPETAAAAEPKAAPAPPASPAAVEAGGQPAPADAPPAAPSAGQPPATTTLRPLAEVADTIRRRLAEPAARDAMEESLKKARGELETYYKQRSRWVAVSSVGDQSSGAEPTPPDPQTLASKYGVIAGEVPLVDETQIGDYELGRAYTFSMQSMQPQRIMFADIAYNSGLPLYKADRILDFQLDAEFLFWKVAEEEPFEPKLADVRSEVVAAWKGAQAFQLARRRAEELAAKVDGTKAMAESLEPELAARVIAPPEFSWLTRGPMAAGMAPPSISEVEGVAAAGDEFMRAVFGLEPGQVGTAPNQSQTMVGVVRLASEWPDEEQRRKQFLESTITWDTFQIANAERMRSLQGWLEDLEKEHALRWSRPPRVFGG